VSRCGRQPLWRKDLEPRTELDLTTSGVGIWSIFSIILGVYRGSILSAEDPVERSFGFIACLVDFLGVAFDFGLFLLGAVEAVGFDVAVDGFTTWMKCLLSGVVACKCRGTMNSPSTRASNNF